MVYHYDEKGHKVGTSNKNMFGGENYYDKHDHKVGSTGAGWFGEKKGEFEDKD